MRRTTGVSRRSRCASFVHFRESQAPRWQASLHQSHIQEASGIQQWGEPISTTLMQSHHFLPRQCRHLRLQASHKCAIACLSSEAVRYDRPMAVCQTTSVGERDDLDRQHVAPSLRTSPSIAQGEPCHRRGSASSRGCYNLSQVCDRPCRVPEIMDDMAYSWLWRYLESPAVRSGISCNYRLHCYPQEYQPSPRQDRPTAIIPRRDPLQ
ncbi:hypothetical protein EJ03DRAFT_91911 [Teratosphaeria nubilosa]|uniref:Uncharacterized protein n=1 Tax=Teratosphaeria nubilosa TaxID=161662 RepID=A0A6G1L9X7_9PEZI|nr:hypothetical protein EJ03DRAFT_91911 [Teratosphaeria nubilosa]